MFGAMNLFHYFYAQFLHQNVVQLVMLLHHVNHYAWVKLKKKTKFFALLFLNASFFCVETTRRCGFFFDVFGLGLPDYLNCNILTDTTDPDICIGLKEVQMARIRAQKPGTIFFSKF